MEINSFGGFTRSGDQTPYTNITVSSTSASSDIGGLESVSQLMQKQNYQLTVSDKAVVQAIEKINKTLEGARHKFAYSIHEKTGQIMVKVINEDTNEVIREIPNEKIADLIASFQEINGLNIDEKR
ncbi:flagellar protein FlaG [Paenibacillus alba]|uniref:flagellar protein FlaG n=1 Tax=Paenibacillus alba TaxID=1197127 RepID=UPI001563CF17|nr:flagellar protein FlaG [Paenibacillus alba]NQX70109.1 flagellar protein FlaG [Paenibacillus alba]